MISEDEGYDNYCKMVQEKIYREWGMQIRLESDTANLLTDLTNKLGIPGREQMIANMILASNLKTMDWILWSKDNKTVWDDWKEVLARAWRQNETHS